MNTPEQDQINDMHDSMVRNIDKGDRKGLLSHAAREVAVVKTRLNWVRGELAKHPSLPDLEKAEKEGLKPERLRSLIMSRRHLVAEERGLQRTLVRCLHLLTQPE